MWNGIGMPSRQPFGQGVPVMMPMPMRPQFQVWGAGRMMPGRMQARPVAGYGTPVSTHMPVSRLTHRGPLPKPGSAAGVKRPLPLASAAGVKRAIPKPSALRQTPNPKALATAASAGVKRKLEGPSASAPPSKFVRGPGATPLPRRPLPQNGVVKSEISDSSPKAAGVIKFKPNPKVAASFLKKSPKAHPTPKPKANPVTSSAPSQSAPSRERKDPELIKADVKMRKVQALTKNLLDEWCSLAEDRKEECWKELATKFRQRVPLEFLQQMLDDSSTGTEETSVVKKEIAEKDPTSFIDTMQQVLSEMIEKDLNKESDLQDLCSFWVKLKIAKESMGAALTAFLHVVIEGGDAQNASLFLHSLLTSNFITIPSLLTSLTNTAKQLEDLTQTNESAWHVHAHIIMTLFPKTQQTTWGYAGKGWSYKTWWTLAHSTLSAADGFRAFDILVLVLQMMQEKTGVVIRDQLAWKDPPERIKQVRETLCKWGEMDETALLETLTAYGVEIA